MTNDNLQVIASIYHDINLSNFCDKLENKEPGHKQFEGFVADFVVNRLRVAGFTPDNSREKDCPVAARQEFWKKGTYRVEIIEASFFGAFTTITGRVRQ
jgi:hypothetical protein